MHIAVSILLTALIGFLIVKLLQLLLRQIHIRKLANRLPGPKGIPILGNMLDLAPLDCTETSHYFLEAADKVREEGETLMTINLLGQTLCVPLDGKTIKPILDSHDEIVKGVGYEFLLPWLGEGLLISSGKKWHTRRKMLTPTFHFQQLNGYVQTFNAECKTFVDVLSEHEGKEVDLGPFIKRCALDIICQTAMGKSVGALRNPNHQYVVAVRNMLWLAVEFVFRPLNWFPPYWYLSGRAKIYRESLNTVLDFTRNVIHTRQQDRLKGVMIEGKKQSFLDMLLEFNESGVLSDEDIREEVDTFMFEGHDTTASGTSWMIWCIAHHPEVQERIRDEIYNVVGDNDITVENLADLAYLDAVTKEVFRLYCPVPVVNRRLQNDFQNGKYLLPKGSILGIFPLLIHRNKKVWGEDADRFNPDRFINDSASDRHPFDYIPFSAGLRNCIGQRFALYEAKIMTSWLVRRYKITSELPMYENGIALEAVLMPQKGVPVRLERV